jgi:hypothetical protein
MDGQSIRLVVNQINIKSRFVVTITQPFNPNAMDDKTKPSHISTITNNREGENITHKMTKLITSKHEGNNLQLYNYSIYHKQLME